MSTANSPSALELGAPTRNTFVYGAASIGLIVLGSIPIFFSWQPAPTFGFFNSHPDLKMLGRGVLTAIIAALVFVTCSLDSERGMAAVIRCCAFVLVGALLTDIHFYSRDIFKLDWQVEQYNGILLHTYLPPDQYRFLPQGILWWMIIGNGDFIFSYLAYRFFATYLLCQFVYKFSRLYLPPRDSVIVVLVYAAFYQLSTRYYYGNMLDPMSHAVMFAALISCHRRHFWELFCFFILGMFIKETMIVMLPCYYLMNLDDYRPNDMGLCRRIALLGAASAVVFLVCRIPFHFNFDFQTLNRTNGLMVFSNLGIPGAQAQSTVSVFQRYLHPVLFIFMWLPLIIWRRKQLPPTLFWTTIYIATSLYFANLCFGWNYESRNFVPALILLLVCTVLILNSILAPEQIDTTKQHL